jgi:hypothetical protein
LAACEVRGVGDSVYLYFTREVLGRLAALERIGVRPSPGITYYIIIYHFLLLDFP